MLKKNLQRLWSEPESPLHAGAPVMQSEVAQLRAKLDQMEKLLHAQAAPAAKTAAAPKSSLLSRGHQVPAPLSNAELQKLKDAVGPPPGRLGRGDKPPAIAGGPSNQDLAEMNLEVREEAEPDLLQVGLQTAVEDFSDPLHKLLALQMKQTADLMKALQPKPPQDPLAAILSVGDSGSGQSSSGSVNVKGYAAREAFLRQLEDDKKVVATIRHNARAELGITEAREEPSLLRTYLETRVPVGDLKTMGQVGYIMAFGWEQAAMQQNVQMMAFCGRMMAYVEQACLDSGRTQLAWMLTGLAEPNHQMLSVHKRRSTLSPFAKLPSPTWVAANVSYLKDIDTFETRLKQLGTTNRPSQPASSSEAGEPPSRPKGKPKKPKGGKGANQSSEDSTAA